MKRFAVGKALARLEGELTTIHPLQIFKMQLALKTIAQMKILQLKLDHLAGWHNVFILYNNVIVIRQLIVRTQEVFWYRFNKTEFTIINDPTELENIYADTFTMD